MNTRRLLTRVGLVLGLLQMSLGGSPAQAAPNGPAAWIGSPISGSVTSAPSNHLRSFGGQWAVDIKGSGTARLYLAKNAAGDPLISARIVQVSYACARIPWDAQNGNPDARRLQRGGKKVVVDVYYNGTRIGRITYAHLDTSLAMGTHDRTINRWGGTLGTVGNYTKIQKPDGTFCWTGQHIHVEAGNVSGQACYWSGLTAGRTLNASNYLGYIGYNSPTRACPSNI